MSFTEDQIRAAWDATKRSDQPVYDGLPHITRGILRRRADNAFDFGLSDDGLWQPFERLLLGGSEHVEPEVPLEPEVVAELVEEVQEELVEPPAPISDPEPPAPEPESKPKKKVTKKVTEKVVEKKPVKVVKKAEVKKVAPTKKAVKK